MKKVCFLLLLINLLTCVWATDSVWFGRVFTSVMNSFTINSEAVSSTNKQCSLDLEVFMTNLANGTYWAAQMDDANVKSVGGIFEGDNFHPGYPSQCIDTLVPLLNISGKYCLASAVIEPSYPIDPDFNTGDFARDYPPYNVMLSYWEGLRHKVDILWHSRNAFKWGLCIPHSCSSQDLAVSLERTLKAACAEKNITINIAVNEADCYTKHQVYSRPVSTGAQVWLAVLYLLVVLILMGTIYDCLLKYETLSEKKRMPKLESVVLPFSLATNISRLVAVPKDDSLSVMFGMKGLSMAILVFGHLGMARFGNRVTNMTFLEAAFRNVAMFTNLNGTIVVDIFFLVSGFLTAQQLSDHLEKKGGVNILLVYLDRIMRVMPTYLFVITFYMYILPLMGQGPRWNEISVRESNRCLQNWWTNLLYINNFVNPSQMCLLQSWYLTADFQMFVFSVPVIYFVLKHPTWRKPILWGLFIGSVVLPSLIIYQNNIWGLFPMMTDWFYDPPSVPYYTDFYIQSYTRYIPYIVGIAAHFICEHLRERETKFEMTTCYKTTVFWTAFLSIQATFLYVSLRFYVNPYQFVLMEHVLYAAIHRLIWSIGWAHVICIHRIGGFGIISDIFGCSIFILPSRLCFTTFLTHIGIILYTISTDEQNWFCSVHKFFISYMGSYLFSLLTALLLTLTVEMPFENFWKRVKRIIMEPPGKRVNADAPVSSMLNQNSVLNQNIGNKNCELTPSLVLNVPEVNLDVEEKNIIGDSVQYTMKL